MNTPGQSGSIREGVTTPEQILIVDDEPRVALYLREALETPALHYHVSVASSGEEALDILRESSIDLLVTDLRMPGISGLDLIRWVRASSPETRVILITAYGNDETAAEAHRLEAYRYLTKPFDIAEFRQAVRDALEDVIVSQPGFTIISDTAFEEITVELERLRHDIGAHSILLADMQGQQIGRVGLEPDIDTTVLLSLLAGSLSIDNELSHHLGSGEGGAPSYHQGEHVEIYWVPVNKDFFLVIVYDRRREQSRMGLVRLYTRRTIESLLATLATAKTADPSHRLDADFGASLMTELEALFGEPADDAPSPEIASEGERLSRTDEDDDSQTRHLFSMEKALEEGLLPPDFCL